MPLDGSRLAEAALPITRQLAQKLSAPVTLVHLIERTPRSRFTASITFPIQRRRSAI